VDRTALPGWRLSQRHEAVVPRQLLDDLAGAIGRAVVDEDELARYRAWRREAAFDLAPQMGCLVADRDDHRQ
jgi:hypothetical protein